MTNYEKIIHDNLSVIFADHPGDLEKFLPAEKNGDRLVFRAFGEECTLGPEGLIISGHADDGPRGLLVTLYARQARADATHLTPYKAFKDFPGSMPYHGAFATNSERVLIPHVTRIHEKRALIREVFDGQTAPPEAAGDFSILLFPLPKIALCYIFYLPDEEFPASVTCLFSANARDFMPLDGLADVAEYTSKRIIETIK
ncbi:MAG: DUF3786 domain-containing protein [Deltaproteobacteria bacterium]|nr:DUF3786 domain-containing protein [Deltaproteobacteria bacterium]